MSFFEYSKSATKISFIFGLRQFSIYRTLFILCTHSTTCLFHELKTWCRKNLFEFNHIDTHTNQIIDRNIGKFLISNGSIHVNIAVLMEKVKVKADKKNFVLALMDDQWPQTFQMRLMVVIQSYETTNILLDFMVTRTELRIWYASKHI